MSDAPHGQIYDLGYKRYVGSKSSVGTRWLVIMRHQMSSMWRGFWRFKFWLVLGFVLTAIPAGITYFLSGQMFPAMGALGGRGLQLADAMLPLSVLWYRKLGFAVGLIAAGGVVASDMQSGAFVFYFARSTRPRDYLLGKLAGLFLMTWLITGLGPLMLALVRLAVSGSSDDLIATLPILPKVLAYGAITTMLFAAVPLGFSALIPNRRYAMVSWAGYYIILGSIAWAISLAGSGWIGAIDLASALTTVTLRLFDVEVLRQVGIASLLNQIPLAPAIISIAVHVVAAVGIVLWRIRDAQQSGVGGAT